MLFISSINVIKAYLGYLIKAMMEAQILINVTKVYKVYLFFFPTRVNWDIYFVPANPKSKSLSCEHAEGNNKRRWNGRRRRERRGLGVQQLQQQELRLQIILQPMQATPPPRRHQNPLWFQVAPSYWRLDLHRLVTLPPTTYKSINFFSFSFIHGYALWIGL